MTQKPSVPFKNPLPGVPQVESPFFDALFADADDATRAIAKQLRSQGYAVMDFPEADIALHVANTEIGAAGLTFRTLWLSVSAT